MKVDFKVISRSEERSGSELDYKAQQVDIDRVAQPPPESAAIVKTLYTH